MSFLWSWYLQEEKNDGEVFGPEKLAPLFLTLEVWAFLQVPCFLAVWPRLGACPLWASVSQTRLLCFER